jgi:beta-phosphoglucomutase-like phosphatase (HAD superfamily)
MVSVNIELFENVLDNIHAVIFDMDGTLFELNVNWQKAKKRLDEYTKSKYNMKGGSNFQSLFSGFKEIERRHGKLAVEELETILSQIEYTDAIQKAKPTDIFNLGVQWIKDKCKNNVKFAIVSSNFRKTIKKVLEKHDAEKMFDKVISREDVDSMKPSPEGIIQVIEDFDLPSSACVYIGDLKSDEDAASAAGVLFLYAQDFEIYIKNLE